MNWISKIQENKILYTRIVTKNTIHLYQKGSRYRIPKILGRARRVCTREGRSYGDVITFSRLYGLRIFLTHDASLAHFLRWSCAMNLSAVGIPICLQIVRQNCIFCALAMVASSLRVNTTKITAQVLARHKYCYLLSSSVTIKIGALTFPAPLIVDANTVIL